MTKLKNSSLDFYSITRLDKETCLNVVKKLEQDIVRWKMDELSTMYYMAQHNYFNENQLRKLVMHLSKQEVSKKL